MSNTLVLTDLICLYLPCSHDERCCASIMEPILPVEKVKEEPEEVIDPLGE